MNAHATLKPLIAIVIIAGALARPELHGVAIPAEGGLLRKSQGSGDALVRGRSSPS
jgi:hypothetical protein